MYSAETDRLEFGRYFLIRLGPLFDRYFRIFDQLGRKPGLLTVSLWKFRKLSNSKSPDLSALNRYMYSNTREEKSSLELNDLPEIDVIFVSKIEDIEILHLAVNLVIQNSLNPIRQVSIAVPTNQFLACKEYFSESPARKIIEVVSENDLVTQEIIDLIKEKSPGRFGWIFQQVLVASYILHSSSKNILIVDSDTLVIRPQAWVDKFDKQLLMPTFELHIPYYDFFQHISNKYPKPEISFVSHHMLVQTQIFREVFQPFNQNIMDALQTAFAFANMEDNSPFDLKYEIYAQYLIRNYPERVSYVKWSNLSVSRSELSNILEGNLSINDFSRRYNSLSFHHWNL